MSSTGRCIGVEAGCPPCHTCCGVDPCWSKPDIPTVAVTPEQIDIMRHALGGSHPKVALGWRNYYCASADDKDLSLLVELGLMERGAKLNNDQDQYFRVTKAGLNRYFPRVVEQP